MSSNDATQETSEEEFVKTGKLLIKLYTQDTTYEEIDSIFANLYLQDAVFEDPLMIVSGREDIRAEFGFLKRALQYQVLNANILEPGTNRPNDLYILLDVRYSISRFFGVTVKHRVRFEMRDGKVQYHNDEWRGSLLNELKMIPLVRWLYAISRRINGRATAIAFKFHSQTCSRSFYFLVFYSD